MTMKLNTSFWKKLDQLEDKAERELETYVKRVADSAINATLESVSIKGKRGAVDTGAYISSFSITYGRGRPRGKSSRRKQRKNPNIAGLAEAAKANLYSDISRLDLLNTTRLTLRNNSPHAVYVEYKHGYFIFEKLERQFNG